MKKIITAIFSLITISVMAQNNDNKNTYPVLALDAGYSVRAKAPSVQLQFGVRTGDVYFSLNEIIAVSRNAVTPKIFAVNAGYNIGSVQPFISAGYQSIGAEAEARFRDTPDEFTNGFRVGYGVSYYFKKFPLSITLQQQGKETIFSAGMYKSF